MPDEDPTAPEEVPNLAARPDSEEAESVEAKSEKAPDTEPTLSPVPDEDWATRYRYLLAEFDNYRKRVERERDQAAREGRSRLLLQLIPIYESFEKARSEAAKLPVRHALRRGIELLGDDLDKLLRAEHVSAVAREGDPFRPSDHEAVGEEASDSGHPEGSVVEIVQQGYRTTGGLLRPAKVIVARTRSPDPSRGAAAEPTLSEADPSD